MESERQDRHLQEADRQLRREQDLAFEEAIAQERERCRRLKEEKDRLEVEENERQKAKLQLECEFAQLTTGSIMPNLNDEQVRLINCRLFLTLR